MADLAQQIRERLDGWAPPTDGGPPPQFVEILDPGDLTQEQIEEWQRHWDEVMVTAADKSLHILAAPPRFYPGFEQMRDVLLAILELHPATPAGVPGKPHLANCTHCRDTGWMGPEVPWPCPTLLAIAEKLGIEVDRD